MPELGEVEFFRRQWDSGLGQRLVSLAVHARTRVFRGVDLRALRRGLAGATLETSQAAGKQMLFGFSGGVWLGIHLGMTGRLEAATPNHPVRKHDHLVLRQSNLSLVFSDMRQFGRIRFERGPAAPAWWEERPLAVTAAGWTLGRMELFLERHGRLPIKAVLLLQDGFPGVGNWMADEVLWRAGIAPKQAAGKLNEREKRALWRSVRFVCRASLRTIGRDYSDPPSGWLFHERWGRAGRCPRDRVPLEYATVGGRTTAWCGRCQGGGRG